jgi:hypothetical protein
MNAIIENDSSIISRHPIYLVYLVGKGAILLVASIGVGALFTFYKNEVPEDLLRYFVFPAVLALANYSILQFALGMVKFYNKLVIIVRDRIIIITSSLFLQEDIEILELRKVMKIDVECHGLLQNMLNYGALIIEQQKNDVRIMHLVPDPFTVLRIIREKTDYLSGTASAPNDLAFFKV